MGHCREYRIFIVVAVVIFSTFSVTAQDSIVDQEVRSNRQLWLDYNFSKTINDIRDISTQIGYRKISPEVYDRMLVISTMNFKNESKNGIIKRLSSFHLGTGLIYTANHNANDNLELRLIQGLRFHIPTIKPVTLHSYLRLEERFQNSFGNGWTAGYRFRYRLSTEIQWKRHIFNFTEGLYFPLEAEMFVNLKRADRFNDVLRLSPGVGYKLKSGWKIETYLIFNRTKNITETNNKSNDFILRIRIRDERGRKVFSEPGAIDTQEGVDGESPYKVSN